MAMTVGELRKALKAFPKDTQVVASKDAEGNGFSPVYELSTGLYESDSSYSGEFSSETGTHNAVCIWPTN